MISSDDALKQRIESLESELAALKRDQSPPNPDPNPIESTATTRRDFMKAGVMGVSLAMLTSSGVEPAKAQTITGANGFRPVPVLVGKSGARPSPGDQFFDNKEGSYLYIVDDPQAEDHGITYAISVPETGWNQITMQNPKTQIDELRVNEFESFFNHTFARPEAPDTKNWDFTAADITKDGSEVELASTTTLESSQRGNYPPGGESIPGVAARVTSEPTGGECFFGYFLDSDDDNVPDDGFGFGVDANGTFTFIAKNGTVRRVRQADWNGVNIDTDPFLLHYPRICRWPHLFYGGGSIAYRIVDHDSGPVTKLKTVHTETPDTAADAGTPFDAGPPIDQPNLPVNFVSNGLTGGNLRANAAHYERGQTEGETRVNGEHFSVDGISTTGWTALISWRKRSDWGMVNVKPLEFKSFAATNDLKLELQLDTALSTPSFSRPTHTSSSETAVEVDTSGTIDTNGERRAIDSVTAGQGSKFGGSASESLEFNLSADKTVTLAAQAEGGEADAFGHLEWREFF